VRSLVAYFAQMAAAPTPLGLFAGCSVGCSVGMPDARTLVDLAPRADYQA